jgi:hypothetical protein
MNHNQASNKTIHHVASQQLINMTQTLPGAAALIDQIQGGSGRRLPLSVIAQWIDALIRGIPYTGYELPKDVQVFRGRISSTRLELSRDFSYRQTSSSSSAGRCNWQGETVFYGALNIDTVFSELRPEVGDTIQIGVSQVKPAERIMVSAIGEIDHIRRFDKPIVGNDKSKAQLKEFLASLDEESKARVLLVDAFFADLFSQPAATHQDYKATGSLARNLLSASSDNANLLDGFLYPSVAHRGGLNIVIKPEALDTKMAWKQFSIYEITENLGFGLYRRLHLADGCEKEDSSIQWTLMGK